MVVGEKCDVAVVVVVVVRSEDNEHTVLLKNKHVAIRFLCF